jgi:hypothetical protein
VKRILAPLILITVLLGGWEIACRVLAAGLSAAHAQRHLASASCSPGRCC